MPSKQGIYGVSLLTNAHPVTQGGLYGRVRMGQPIDKGQSLYGHVYFIDHALGFHGSTLTIAELYEVTCQDGSIARFTSHGEDITYNGDLYTAIPMQRGKIGMHSDLQVDKVSLELGLIGITVGSKAYTMPQLIKRGFLRQARVRIFAVDYELLTWEKFRFDGYITDTIGYNSGVLSLQIGSILDRLQDKFPKLTYSEFCPHRVYGSYCGLNADTYRESGAVLFGSTRARIYADVFLYANQAAGYWMRGELIITEATDEEYNVSRTILTHGDGYVDLMLPFHGTPSTGSSFNVLPGCDKSGQTCDEKFGNYENFLGFEYIPRPEVLYG
jgi:uncharacterized phage protein (TIGR02218 family)